MRRIGVDVDLVVMHGKAAASQPPLDPETRIVDLQSPRLWSCLPALVKYIRRERPAAIIAAAWLGNGLAGLAKRLSGRPIPVILTEHALLLFRFAEEGAVRHKVLKALLTRGYRAADAFVAVSHGVADELRKLPFVAPSRIHVIYNPVWSPELVSRSQQPAEHPWLSDGSTIPVLISAGRLDRLKGFDTLLRALVQVRQKRDARLIILGEGEERTALESLVSKLDLEDCVDMPGFVANPERFMSRAAVFVLSSRTEALPTVLIESLACGTPIVSTDCRTGPREILEESKYGTLVPVDDAGALAAAILEKLTDPGDRNALRSRAKDFSEEAAARQYLELIDRIYTESRYQCVVRDPLPPQPPVHVGNG